MNTDADDLLAAEYVLGALDAATRADVAGRAMRDAAFAAKISAWEQRLADLNDDYTPITAPNLLPNIESRLFGTPRRGGWGRLGNWSWLDNLFGQAVLTALSVALLAWMLTFSQGEVFTTTLSADSSTLRYTARLEEGQLSLNRTAGKPASAGHSYELWIILDGQDPKSLGVIDESLTLSAPTAGIGYVLAVTEEPAGGAPYGKPTGALVASGRFEKI